MYFNVLLFLKIIYEIIIWWTIKKKDLCCHLYNSLMAWVCKYMRNNNGKKTVFYNFIVYLDICYAKHCKRSDTITNGETVRLSLI